MVDTHVASEKCFLPVEVFKHLDTGTCLSGMRIPQDTSDDIMLALPARHDREAFVLADCLDMSYSTKYSLQFLQRRFIILYEGIRFLHLL